MSAISVVLADDDAAVRHQERELFGSDDRFAVVGEAVDGAAAVRLARTLQPRAVVLDTTMPGIDAWGALALIRRVAPTTAVVIVYTPGGNSDLDDQSVWPGADACIAKPDLASALDTVTDACGFSARLESRR